MNRHQALIPLSHDHQHGLAQALRLRRAVDAGSPAEIRAEAVLASSYCEQELWSHFTDEEESLVPLLTSDCPICTAQAEQLWGDHAQIRQIAATLAAAIESDDAAAIFASVASLATLLHDHIRWEERTMFEHVQEHHAAVLEALDLPAR